MSDARFRALALAFSSLLPLTASAYVREATRDATPVPLFRTDNTGIQFFLNSGVAPGAQSALSGQTVTVIAPGSDPVAAVRNALATWNSIDSANIRFLPLQSTSAGISASDNRMVLAIASSAAEASIVGGALAVTNYVYNPVDQVINGVRVPKGAMLDTDIIISPNYAFSTDGSTANDLQAVLTHELGHALGANHTGLLGASMFQFNSGQRFLTSDDTTFAGVVYPRGAGLGTIGGVLSVNGAPVPYGLLTAFDTTTGVTVGGISNSDGSYSFEVPPGTYQLYAEPLNGVVPINVSLTRAQSDLANSAVFQTTFYPGSLDVVAGSTATANIAVTPGASALATPYVGVSPVNGSPQSAFAGGPAILPSGGRVDLILAGAGFNGSLTESNFAVYGQGISVVPGSVRLDSGQRLGGFPDLRITLEVAPTNGQSLASFVVTAGGSTSSFSGALIVVPPQPRFVPAGVISAAPYTGIQGGVTPGGIYSIYDIPGSPNLGPVNYLLNGPYDAYGQLATLLGGVSVTFDGVPAPMFLALGTQLNFQVPFEVAGKASTKVIVSYLGSSSAPVTVPVLAVQPSFFTSCGSVCAINLADGTVNSANHPAPRSSSTTNSFVELYGTGVGKVSYDIATGHGAPLFPAGYTGNYTYSICGLPARPALFGGYTPGAVGLAQWDIQIPANCGTGAQPITVTDASGVSSPSGMTIYIK